MNTQKELFAAEQTDHKIKLQKILKHIPKKQNQAP